MAELLAPGDSVGEYLVEAPLGEGGFGTVYRAVHREIGKRAAVKVLHRKLCADPEAVGRFIAEARAVNRVGHGSIVDIFAFGQLPDGRHYHVMELLEGRTLAAHLLERGALEPREALAILAPVAGALDAAHARGIAHRDLKPENVLLVEEEGRLAPRLIDFGLAKVFADEPGGMARTRTGALLGTPEYMSPEQCRGRTVDHRTDIYAFGVLAYRMLVGRLPFTGEDTLEVMMKQATERPEPPSRARRGLPSSVDAPLLAMLEKRPERRPPDLATALASLEAGLLGRTRRRRRLAWATAAAAAALAAFLLLLPRSAPVAEGALAAEAAALHDAAPPADAALAPPDARPPPLPDAAPPHRRPAQGRSRPGPEDVEDPYR